MTSYILGIETSCDDTCAAIVDSGRTLISNACLSSALEQNTYGGVVPEIASRRHIESISEVCEQALLQANLSVAALSGVAATFAPGLIGAVLVGLNYAKGLAYSAQKPLIPVHHLRGHIAALYLSNPKLEPPFLCLVASGGHSHIVMVHAYCRFEVLGRTLDDAAGEAFDKVSRTLGLGYPGGPAVSAAAKNGNSNAYALPTPKAQGEYNVSFSGLKTAVLNHVNRANMTGEPINISDMAASFEYRITEILADKLLLAAKNYNVKKICVAGGVGANTALRELLQRGAQRLSAQLYLPEPSLCTDNAAMIAAQGYFELLDKNIGDMSQNGYPTMPIDYR